MLKVVSNFVNAIGAVNYQGTWNAATNNPAIASGVGVKGNYYVVGTAGTTTVDGISTWYVGDWIVFNGTVWQRVQGGTDDPAPSLLSNSTTGLMQITGPAAGTTRVVTIPNANSTMARTDAAQTFTGDQTISTGNLVIGTAGKGIDFSADPSAAGMTSELLDDYEEGTWTPTLSAQTAGNLAVTYSSQIGFYTKVGRLVTVNFFITTSAFTHSTASDALIVSGLPFTVFSDTGSFFFGSVEFQGIQKPNYTQVSCAPLWGNSYCLFPASGPSSNQNYDNVQITEVPSGGSIILRGSVTYIV